MDTLMPLNGSTYAYVISNLFLFSGNSWETDPVTNIPCIGCGAQEYFVNSASVGICSRYDSSCETLTNKDQHRNTNHAIARTTGNYAHAYTPTNLHAIQIIKRINYILPEETFDNQPTSVLAHVATSSQRIASFRAAQVDTRLRELSHIVLENSQNYKTIAGKRSRSRSTMEQCRKRMSPSLVSKDRGWIT